ncbi:MAG: AAA family ATPase [Acidobacteriota bacterium]|nr:AAA family ATPase [Acidobacteriota bacterium]
MIHISGYQISKKLHESDHTVVYRGRKVDDDLPIIVKVSAKEFPSTEVIKRFRREFELGRGFVSNRIIQYYGLEPYQHGLAIIAEDFGAVGLSEVIPKGGMDPIRFLRTAIQLSEGLAAIHGKNLIHKDIKPGNVVISPDTGEVKYIDFGHSEMMELQGAEDQAKMEGTLAYMSPEQTGRMNRPVDYRTDFYSLGVTFYQLLTGDLPFDYEDTLELVHAHIAKTPEPPHFSKKGIPEIISQIIMKLMSKNADDRYQSGRGLKNDLEHCLEDLEIHGEIKPFKLGMRDITNRFSIPQKLYGREQEIEALMKAYERVADGGREMVLVEGYSGVGKSALVNEIRLAIFARKGFFIRGTCDQTNPNASYLPISGAFSEWVRQILGEHDEVVREWRERLVDVLGNNAQVLTDVIPELALLLESREDHIHLGHGESRNRFGMVFRGLVKGITAPGSPLVLFLDDIHWADTLSIKLLEMILSDKNITHLMVIGTTKQHGLDANPELNRSVDEVERRGAMVSRLRLGPLRVSDLTRMLVDTLHCEPEEARPLADILSNKANGNPFFTHALLKNLYHEKHIRFSHEQSRWDWDLTSIRQIRVSDNVIDFMIGRLKKLPAETQRALQMAACLGGYFNAEKLAQLAERTPEELAGVLRNALRQGVIMEVGAEGGTYQFQHDRVQQAAYALIDERRKMEYHLRIGRLMLEQDEEEAQVFELVGHLNQARELMEEEEERLTLARLNLSAGKKAKAATSFDNALKYLRTCFSLMPEDAWDRLYNLVFELFWESAECYYLAGSFKTAEKFSGRLLEMACDDLQKAAIYKMRLVHYTLASKMDAAVEAGLQGLALLGLNISANPNRLTVLREGMLTRAKLLRIQPEDLINYKEMDNARVAAIIEVLAEIGQPAYLTGNKNLFTFSVLKRVNLTLKHGISAMSANTFAMFACLLNSVLSNMSLGNRFGKVALEMCNRFEDNPYRSVTLYTYSIFVHCWNNPWSSLASRLRATVDTSLQSGDLLYVAYTISAMHYFDPNETLATAIEESDNNLSLIENIKGQDTWRFARLVQQFRLNLTGQTRNRYSLDTEDFDEQETLEHFRDNNVNTGSALYHLLKLRLFYMYESYERTTHHLKALSKVVKSFTGQPFSMQACFFSFLARAGAFHKYSKAEKRQAWGKMKTELSRMKRWSTHNPANFGYHRNLMEAEMARLKGKFRNAVRHYRKAMEGAHRHGSYGDEALICELAGKFYHEHHQEKIASMFYTEAHYLYGRWGASAKVRQMEENYGSLLGPSGRFGTGKRESPVRQTEPRHSQHDATLAQKSDALDLATVTKWSLAIASEMHLEKLMSKMMGIILENAGAQKGFLILEQENQMIIHASLSVDDNKVDLAPVPLDSNSGLSRAIVRYVIRTGENVVLKDAAREGLFMEDKYILGHRPKSVLCTPIKQKERISGVLYLENNLITNAFTADRIRILNILLAQAAISLENARLYQETKHAEEKYRRLNEELEERVTDRTHELEAAQKELVEKAHLAGMADIATSVLHNVGNILNSVITSGQIIKKRVENSSTRKLIMANSMLRRNLENLEHFILEDPKGKQLLDYYLRLEEPLDKEADEMVEDVNRLMEKVNTIREVIMAQQSHASRGFQAEYMSLSDVVEDALIIVENSYARESIQVENNFDEVPQVYVQKVKLIHIMVNLLKNAKEAFEGTETLGRRVTITIETDGEYNYVRFKDNGVGITDEDKAKLFIHGFTTKAAGHGFGLHSCANAMTEMSGNIWAESDGAGKGATFVLQFPLDRDALPAGHLEHRIQDAGC